MSNESIIILDNGAYTAKVGLSTADNGQCIPNCVMKAKSERRRAFIGNQIEECRDVSGLFFILAFQKGYLNHWEVQKTVWDHIFSADCTDITLQDSILIVTEPWFNFNSIQEAMTEIFFEEFDCEGLVCPTATDLTALNYAEEQDTKSCLVIDMGFSFTHLVPYIKAKPVKQAIRRIDVGGKVLTNHLKEILSYRHLNLMDESYVVNQLKEDVCFVSQDFKSDMKISALKNKSNNIIQEYVLPDFNSIQRGYIKKETDPTPDQQVIRINNERFSVPEVLFNPSDVGINQMGIPEAVIHCLSNCPEYAHSILLKNIIVVGGCSKFPGMAERLYSEIRAFAPNEFEINITISDNPILYAWQGGKKLSKLSNFKEYVFSKNEYEEYGTFINKYQ